MIRCGVITLDAGTFRARHHRGLAAAAAATAVAGLGGLFEAAVAQPAAKANGDFVRPARRTLAHPRWRVVEADPGGLRCRMPRAFQGLAFDERLPWNQRESVGEVLLVDGVHAIDRWEVAAVLPPGTVFTAYGGHLGALILVNDTRGRPWLPITFRGRPCLVRAHRDRIQPI